MVHCPIRSASLTGTSSRSAGLHHKTRRDTSQRSKRLGVRYARTQRSEVLGTTTAIRLLQISLRAVPAIGRSWTSLAMSPQRCSNTTAISVWKRSDELSRRSLIAAKHRHYRTRKTINAQLDVWMPQELRESAEMLGVAQQSEVGAYQKSTQATELEHSVRLRSKRKPLKGMAPQVGLEPTTLRLTAECSAIELLRNR